MRVGVLVFLLVMSADGLGQRENRMVFQPGSKVPEGQEADVEGGVREGATGGETDGGGESEAVEAETAGDGEEVVGAVEPALMSEIRGGLRIPAEIDKALKVFFGLLGKQTVEGAYAALVKGSVIEQEPTDVTTLREKTEQALRLFGEIRGYEIVDVQRVGGHLMAVTSISLGEYYPLRWKFYYYLSGENWGLIDIRVDDRLSDMFQEKSGGEASDGES